MARLLVSLAPGLGIDSLDIPVSIAFGEPREIDLDDATRKAVEKYAASRWVKTGSAAGEVSITTRQPAQNDKRYRPLSDYIVIEEA